jgi:hypothetical protein
VDGPVDHPGGGSQARLSDHTSTEQDCQQNRHLQALIQGRNFHLYSPGWKESGRQVMPESESLKKWPE